MSTAKTSAQVRAELTRAYQDTFTSEKGQLVLEDLMRHHGILNIVDPKHTNDVIFREGERNVIVRILHKLNMDVGAILKMGEERHEEII